VWFWISVGVVAVAVYGLLRWRSGGGGGPRPFYQTRNELREMGEGGRFNQIEDERPRDY
jgi:hypothetical protein